MTEFITYRLTGTGVWGYEFFDMDHNQIGFVRNALSRADSAISVSSAGIAGASARCLPRLTHSGRFCLRQMPHRGIASFVPPSGLKAWDAAGIAALAWTPPLFPEQGGG